MLTLKVDAEGDKVIIDLGSRRTDMLISVDLARRLAAAIEEKAAEAELEPAELVEGKPWGINIRSFDKQVGFKFYPPEEAAITRVPLPVRMVIGEDRNGNPVVVNTARKVAGIIRFASQQAEHGLRFIFSPATPQPRLRSRRVSA